MNNFLHDNHIAYSFYSHTQGDPRFRQSISKGGITDPIKMALWITVTVVVVEREAAIYQRCIQLIADLTEVQQVIS
jgi:hypothetical protein